MDRPREERDRVEGQFVYAFILFRTVGRAKDEIKDKRQLERKRREESFEEGETQSPSSRHLPAGIFFKKINFRSG